MDIFSQIYLKDVLSSQEAKEEKAKVTFTTDDPNFIEQLKNISTTRAKIEITAIDEDDEEILKANEIEVDDLTVEVIEQTEEKNTKTEVIS